MAGCCCSTVALLSTSIPSISGSVLRFSIAAVTLELESAEVPDAGENVSSFSGLLLLDEEEQAVASAVTGGNNLSISALPNSQPAGNVSSEQRANNTVLSQTRLVYNRLSPLSTVNPNSEPQ